MTRNAKLILAMIETSTDHLTAEEIYLRLKEENNRVVLATVYNNLNALYEQNLIRKISIEGSPDRYDKIIRHDHLICRECGKISDIALDDLTEKLHAATGEDVLSYDLKISYICPACKERAADAKG